MMQDVKVNLIERAEDIVRARQVSLRMLSELMELPCVSEVRKEQPLIRLRDEKGRLTKATGFLNDEHKPMTVRVMVHRYPDRYDRCWAEDGDWLCETADGQWQVLTDAEYKRLKDEQRERKKRHGLLPHEFHVRGLYSNGCMCQPGVTYVAEWIWKSGARATRHDIVAATSKQARNRLRIRIWDTDSYFNDDSDYRIGQCCDWTLSVVGLEPGIGANYEIIDGED
jgi:hypothetical protein